MVAQAGGVVGFAGLVYWELRQLRTSVERVAEFAIRLEERDRERSYRRAA
jgi:hypothetical protein